MAGKRIHALDDKNDSGFQDYYIAVDKVGNDEAVRVPALEFLGGNYEEITYNELQTLITNEELTPGKFYLLTDYQTIYLQPDFYSNGDKKVIDQDMVKTGFVEPILVYATSTNTLSNDAKSIDFPSDIIEYDSTSETLYDDLVTMGKITRRKDKFGNDIPFDFRNVLFKRYGIEDPLSNPPAQFYNSYKPVVFNDFKFQSNNNSYWGWSIFVNNKFFISNYYTQVLILDETFTLLQTINLPDGFAYGLTYDPNTNRVFIGGSNRYIDAVTNTLSAANSGYLRDVVIYNPINNLLYTPYSPNSLTPSVIEIYDTDLNLVDTIVPSPDVYGAWYITCNTNNGDVYISWSDNSGAVGGVLGYDINGTEIFYWDNNGDFSWGYAATQGLEYNPDNDTIYVSARYEPIIKRINGTTRALIADINYSGLDPSPYVQSIHYNQGVTTITFLNSINSYSTVAKIVGSSVVLLTPEELRRSEEGEVLPQSNFYYLFDGLYVNNNYLLGSYFWIVEGEEMDDEGYTYFVERTQDEDFIETYMFGTYDPLNPYEYGLYNKNNVILPIADTGDNITGTNLYEQTPNFCNIWTINSVFSGNWFNNQFGNNFINNTMGVLVDVGALPLPFNVQHKNNIIGGNFKNNTIGIGFSDNYIFSEFIGNTAYYKVYGIPNPRTEFFSNIKIMSKVTDYTFTDDIFFNLTHQPNYLEIVANIDNQVYVKYLDENGAVVTEIID